MSTITEVTAEVSERSASLSFSDSQKMQLFDENTTMEAPKTNTISPGSINRKKFIKSAPSLIQLLAIGNTSPNTERLDDIEEANDNVFTSENEENNHSNNNNNNDFQELALKAAKEFDILTSQNDELFREKEQYKQKYDDIIHEMEDLASKLNEAQLFKEGHQQLSIENANYESKMKIYQQEKQILQETIQDLKNKDIQQQHVQEYNDPDIMDVDNHNHNRNDNNNKLMVKITHLTKEKRRMEEELEAFKLVVNDKTSNVNLLNQKLLVSESECKRLSDNLTAQQDIYIQLEQSKNQQRHRYDRKMTVTTNEIEDEHKAKQSELKKRMEDQKRKILELERENRELQNEKFSKTKRKSGMKQAHLRLRTKQNVFGGETFDEDPFGCGGGDDYQDDEQDEFMSGSGSSDGDDGVRPTFHVQSSVVVHDSDDVEDINNYIIPAHLQDDSMELTQVPKYSSNSCGCFISFFNKFKNKSKNLADAKPLAIQEIRSD